MCNWLGCPVTVQELGPMSDAFLLQVLLMCLYTLHAFIKLQVNIRCLCIVHCCTSVFVWYRDYMYASMCACLCTSCIIIHFICASFEHLLCVVLSASFDMKISVDGLFFIGNQLVALSYTGKVAVWQSMTQHWQVLQCVSVLYNNQLNDPSNLSTTFYLFVFRFQCTCFTIIRITTL